MRVTNEQLDNLLRLAILAVRDARLSPYGRQLAEERVAAFEELKQLRAGIAVEGTVR
jgi:hypothetical protein